jgi:hypothetical protein
MKRRGFLAMLAALPLMPFAAKSAYATGGYHSGGTYIVGRRGYELEATGSQCCFWEPGKYGYPDLASALQGARSAGDEIRRLVRDQHIKTMAVADAKIANPLVP